MIPRSTLLAYLDQLLTPERFNDYCPNGLQVEGAESIKTIVTGVTASEALIDAAIMHGADALLVHHGYFWRGESLPVVGVKQRRIHKLLDNQINLIAYHLPLDAHPELGNNARLADVLGLPFTGMIADTGRPALACYGELEQPISLDALTTRVEDKLKRAPMVIDSGSGRDIESIGWCTGAAQNYIVQAAEQGLSAFISGEISEQTVHLARELGIHYIAAGHHATERYGVNALGENLMQQYDIEHYFVDIDNPV